MSGDLFAQALGLSVAAGVSPYATVALLGLAQRIGWIGVLPAHLSAVSDSWVITLAVALTLVEFVATLVPGIASAWEAAHTAIRPPAAAVLGALVVWGAARGSFLRRRFSPVRSPLEPRSRSWVRGLRSIPRQSR
jgi:hypothetical protein